MTNETLQRKPGASAKPRRGSLLHRSVYGVLFALASIGIAGCGEKPTEETSHRQNARASWIDVAPAVHTETFKTGICENIPPKTIDPSLVIKGLADELAVCAGAGELTRTRALELLGKHLGQSDFADIFDVLANLMNSSDSEGRIAALRVLSVLKGEWSVEEVDDDDAPACPECVAESSGRIVPVEVEQRAVYAMMTLALQDGDASVRSAAYETLLTLPHEERSALSLQLLGNDDVALKERLLESCAGDDGEFARNVSFQGLDADEPSVRALAERNCKQLFGRGFSSSDEALAWYGQQVVETTEFEL